MEPSIKQDTYVIINAKIWDEDRDGFYWVMLSDGNQVRIHKNIFTLKEK